jgi:hypothetical protein
MNTSDYELSHPFSFRRPRPPAASVPFTGDVDAWLIQLEVSTPFDADRLRDQDRWRKASDKEHGEALVSLLSVADAMRGQIRPKPPLRVCFPYPYRPPGPDALQQ